MFQNIKETGFYAIFSLTHCCVKYLKYKQDYNMVLIPHGHYKVFFVFCLMPELCCHYLATSNTSGECILASCNYKKKTPLKN